MGTVPPRIQLLRQSLCVHHLSRTGHPARASDVHAESSVDHLFPAVFRAPLFLLPSGSIPRDIHRHEAACEAGTWVSDLGAG